MGLSIARRIVDRHGGRMWAESRTGVGSTFFMGLPVSLGTRADEEQEAVHGHHEAH
jgi:signal transduction histidine kinase